MGRVKKGGNSGALEAGVMPKQSHTNDEVKQLDVYLSKKSIRNALTWNSLYKY